MLSLQSSFRDCINRGLNENRGMETIKGIYQDSNHPITCRNYKRLQPSNVSTLTETLKSSSSSRSSDPPLCYDDSSNVDSCSQSFSIYLAHFMDCIPSLLACFVVLSKAPLLPPAQRCECTEIAFSIQQGRKTSRKWSSPAAYVQHPFRNDSHRKIKGQQPAHETAISGTCDNWWKA